MNCETSTLTEHSYTYWSRKISFSLFQGSRKQLRIEVTPEMEVVVKAPQNRSISDITDRVIKKSPWIIKQCIFFQQFYPKISDRKYKSWETFYYLWKQYILKLVQDSSNYVDFKWVYMLLGYKKNKDPKKVLTQRYLAKAKEKFNEYDWGIRKRFSKYGVAPQSLKVRTMKTRRWSCSKKWNITLNTELVQAPRWCIEYVLNHEYCHLIEFWHTRKFYDLQETTMPDWKKRKNKLERLLA